MNQWIGLKVISKCASCRREFMNERVGDVRPPWLPLTQANLCAGRSMRPNSQGFTSNGLFAPTTSHSFHQQTAVPTSLSSREVFFISLHLKIGRKFYFDEKYNKRAENIVYTSTHFIFSMCCHSGDECFILQPSIIHHFKRQF